LDGWSHQIVEVAEGFVGASPAQAGNLLRQLHGALVQAPADVSQAMGEPCRQTLIDALIDAEAFVELAYLIAGRTGMLVSRFPDGSAQATVVSPTLFGEMDHENASVPLAIGGALVAGLVSWSRDHRAQPHQRSALN
jgi:hypothetical protein